LWGQEKRTVVTVWCNNPMTDVTMWKLHGSGKIRLTVNHVFWQTLWISNFHRIVNVILFLVGDSLASEFYVPRISELSVCLSHRLVRYSSCSHEVWRCNSVHSCTVHPYTVESFIYPTDAQLDCSKNVKIYMRGAATCFGSSQPSSVSYYMCFFYGALRPNAGHGLLIFEVSRSHTTTHHSR
jgi:hypothetical protein